MLGGEFSTSAIIAGSNTILIGLVASAVFAGRRKSFREARIIFHFVTLETALIIALLLAPGSDWFTNVMLYIPFSYLSFFTVAFILSELDGHFHKLEGIERQSKTDYLTQLNNSRMFGELSGWMIGSGRLVSLILLDIDHFKKVNDTYGHPVGDEVLRELAKRMRNTALPDGAILSRNGGEEFSVLLPGIGREEAAEAAEQLRNAIGNQPFRLDGALSIPVTISLGVCTYPAEAANSKELYDRADAALYHAKNSGRNRTVSWTAGSHVSSGSMELAYDQTMKR